MEKNIVVRRGSIMEDESHRRESVAAMTTNVTGE
jgi:hypothetical protein